MLAGSTQQLLHPRKDSHLREGHIPSAVSEPFSTLCQKVCRSSVSQDKTHRFKNMVYTWPCHSPHSATELGEKHSICGGYGRKGDLQFTSVCEQVGKTYHFYHPECISPPHPHSLTVTQTSAETHNATCCIASFARSFRTCQEQHLPILFVQNHIWDCPSLTLPLWPFLSSPAFLIPSADIIVSLEVP